jgi:hypothetical protein
MKARLFLVGCSLGILAIFVALRRAGVPRPAGSPVDVRLETLEKLERGMGESDIASLLGAPPGDYRTNKEVHYFFDTMGALPPGPGQAVLKEWLTDDWAINVWFGSDGKAVGIERARGMPPLTWIESLMISIRYGGPIPSMNSPW